jgi:hypothetical protein
MADARETHCTPVGRIVNGHPMEHRGVTDSKTKQPVIGADGQPVTEVYFGFAIPKGSETHWRETAWGMPIWNAGATGYPQHHMGRDFSWKIVDGDDQTPNRKGNIPANQEGYPGHWVVHFTTRFGVTCYMDGHFAPHEAIQNPKQFKRGDYGRVVFDTRDNRVNGADAQTPGVYVNPVFFAFVEAGQEIKGAAPDAAAAFGAPAATQAPTATQAPAATPAPVATPAPTDIQPVPGFADGPAAPVEKSYRHQNGQVYTESQLRGYGFNDAQIAALPEV